jgi:hypothetical protein
MLRPRPPDRIHPVGRLFCIKKDPGRPPMAEARGSCEEVAVDSVYCLDGFANGEIAAPLQIFAATFIARMRSRSDLELLSTFFTPFLLLRTGSSPYR